MAVLSVVPSNTGFVANTTGVNSLAQQTPTFIQIQTNDTLSAVLVTGYLNKSKNVYGSVYNNQQVALVYTTDQGPVWLKVVISGINTSLVAILNNFTTTVTLSQTQVQGAYATPVQLVAAPGAGLALLANKAVVYTNFQTSPFANGGVGIVQYDSTVHGAGTDALSATIPAAEITAAASQLYVLYGSTATVLTGITNKGLYFSNQTGAFTGGSSASTVVITLNYSIVTATV